MNERRKGIGIVGRLLAMALIPVLILGVFLSVYSTNLMESALQDESLDSLNGTANSCLYMVSSYFDQSAEDGTSGPFDPAYKEDLQELCDYIKNKTGIDITIFNNDIRYVTSIRDSSGALIVGTAASPEVTDTVIKKGNEMQAENLVINGKDYYAYYVPINDPAGKVIGMVFAGELSSTVNKAVSKTTTMLTLFSSIIFFIVIITSTLISRNLGSHIKNSIHYVTTLAEGCLSFEISEKGKNRSDELGDLNRSIVVLRDTLKNLASNITQHSTTLSSGSDTLNTMSDAYAQTAGQIALTIDELSRSVVNLAEEVQDCCKETDSIGHGIEDITTSLGELKTAMQNTRVTSENARDTIVSLTDANKTSVEAVNNIVTQVYATNKAVADITGITSTLNDITSQVNLLSLNASIEAARAGEAGRGFAVVADEIRSLADQSAASTSDIIGIIANLTNEAERTITLANNVKDAILLEHESLIKTDQSFDTIQKNIQTIDHSLDQVNAKTVQLDNSKIKMVDSMTTLSAISQENAASAEEVTASCEELSANTTLLNEQSVEIKNVSSTLAAALSFFKS